MTKRKPKYRPPKIEPVVDMNLPPSTRKKVLAFKMAAFVAEHNKRSEANAGPR